VLFAVALFAATSPVTHPDAAQGAHAKIVRFYPNAMLLRALPGWMADFWKTRADDAAALVAALAVAVTFVPWPGSESPEGRRARWLGRSLVLVAAAFYFAMPSQVGFAFILDLRLAPIVGLFAVLLARRVQGRLADASAALALTGALATSAVGLSEMRAYETEEAARLDILLKRLPAGKRLLSLVFDPASRHAIIPPFVHAGAYYRARYGGIASFSFSELPHWPVRYRPEAAPPKKHVVFWDYAPCLFRNTEDGPHYDFVLVRGDVDPFESDPPGPSTGRWPSRASGSSSRAPPIRRARRPRASSIAARAPLPRTPPVSRSRSSTAHPRALLPTRHDPLSLPPSTWTRPCPAVALPRSSSRSRSPRPRAPPPLRTSRPSALRETRQVGARSPRRRAISRALRRWRRARG
jgi:hypothetical protein